jgi:hypothetical protein
MQIPSKIQFLDFNFCGLFLQQIGKDFRCVAHIM